MESGTFLPFQKAFGAELLVQFISFARTIDSKFEKHDFEGKPPFLHRQCFSIDPNDPAQPHGLQQSTTSSNGPKRNGQSPLNHSIPPNFIHHPPTHLTFPSLSHSLKSYQYLHLHLHPQFQCYVVFFVCLIPCVVDVVHLNVEIQCCANR